MSARVVIRMPGEGKEITLAGQPMTFLVTGQDSKHTSMAAPRVFVKRICVRGDARPPLHTHKQRESTRNTPPRFRVEKG